MQKKNYCITKRLWKCYDWKLEQGLQVHKKIDKRIFYRLEFKRLDYLAFEINLKFCVCIRWNKDFSKALVTRIFNSRAKFNSFLGLNK